MTIVKTFHVKGMYCASCAALIQKMLLKRAGIASAEVNYGNESAKIAFADEAVSAGELSKLTASLGYVFEASGERGTSAPAENRIHDDKLHEIADLREKLLIAMPMAATAIIIMTWHIGASLRVLPAIPYVWYEFFHHLLPVMATYVFFVVGKPCLQALLSFLRHGNATMNALIGMGTAAAFIYSFVVTAFEASLKPYIDVTHNYYDVTIVVISFATLGRYLEARAKLRTGDALEKLLGLQAKTALVVRGGREVEVGASEVVPGDFVVVKPGAKIPVDGIVSQGESYVDESLVTGESMPVAKKLRDAVVAGTMNTSGSITFRATKVGSETLLANIITMVGDAQASKAPAQVLADKISAVFVPSVLAFALVTLVTWLTLGTWSYGFQSALTLGLSSFVGVLVIACPCALGLATPTAITVAVGKGAREGILIKDASTLEKLCHIGALVVDKTGTLTEGKPELVELRDFSGWGENRVLAILASLENKSEHPIAHAILARAERDKVPTLPVSLFEALKGRGVKGVIDNVEYFAGSVRLARERGLSLNDEEFAEQTKHGRTPIVLGSKNALLAVAFVADPLKPAAIHAVAQLKGFGIRVIMLTGDAENTARHIAKEEGIDEVFAEALPAAKLDKIKELQSQGLVVAMAGDGVNDAPALAQADVGIAMATGADAAIETAGVTLLNGDISKLAKAVKLSRRTMATLIQNLFWAFAFNIVGIPLAAGLFYPLLGWTLSPVFAGMAMAFSSVIVVTNSLRLKSLNLQERTYAKTQIFHISGMHCKSCERLTENTLSGVPGVSKVTASLANNTVEIAGDFGGKSPSEIARELSAPLKEHGFSLSLEKTVHEPKWAEFGVAIPAAVVFIALFVLLLNLTKGATASHAGYGMAFTVGLIASVSSCMAVVGGLVLSLSSFYAKEGDRLVPQVLFHMGRLAGFFVLGGVIGAAGAMLKPTLAGSLVLGLAVGAVMIVMGVNLLDIVHWTKRLQPTLPDVVGDKIGGVMHREVMPFAAGVATFFLPCGFTQSMQLTALNTGTFLTGALTMLAFATGTFPALALLSFSPLGVGLKKARQGVFFKTAGLVVVFFGIYNIYTSLVAFGTITPLFQL